MEVRRTEEGGVCGGSSQINVQIRLEVTTVEEYCTKLQDTIDKIITEMCGSTRGVTHREIRHVVVRIDSGRYHEKERCLQNIQEDKTEEERKYIKKRSN